MWDLQGPVPELVYEQYYGRSEIASGTGVAADGWYYWNELVDGHLQIRGVDVVTGDTLTTNGTTFEKAGAHPAGRAVPHLVSFFGGTSTPPGSSTPSPTGCCRIPSPRTDSDGRKEPDQVWQSVRPSGLGAVGDDRNGPEM